MAEDEQPILEETATDQRIIPFTGDDLAAALSENGDIYISVPGMCAALGLNSRGQLQRIQRTRSLSKGLRRIRLKTPTRGYQLINCLRLDRVALWIAGIETERINPEYQAKIEAYQDELAPVAMRIFMRSMAIAIPEHDPRLTALMEQADTLMTAATFITEHMNSLLSMPEQLDQAVKLLESLSSQQEVTTAAIERLSKEEKLSAAQKQYIKEAVNRIVEDTHDKPGKLGHAQIYAALYRQFRVNSYAELPMSQYEAVLTFLRDLWKRGTNGETPEQQSLF
jgi:hypothetical protein